MEAVIFVGGLGTRLRETVPNLPKPMAPVAGKPFLDYLIKFLEKNKVSKIILSVGFKSDIIINYYSNHNFNLDIKFSEEITPLGTGGALKKSLELIENKDFFVLNGDTYFPINLKNFLEFHKNVSSDLTIASYEIKNELRYASLSLNDDGKVTNIEKSISDKCYINAGIYIFNKYKLENFFKFNKNKEKFSLEDDVFPVFIKKMNVYANIFHENFIDIGLPKDYKNAYNFVNSFK